VFGLISLLSVYVSVLFRLLSVDLQAGTGTCSEHQGQGQVSRSFDQGHTSITKYTFVDGRWSAFD